LARAASSFERGETHWRVRYEARFHCRARERVEAVFSTLLHLGRWISGGAFTPDSIHFQHRAAAGITANRELLGCPTDFEARENEIVFPARQAGLPLIQSNAAVTRHLRVMADRMMEGLDSQTLTHQVQLLLQEYPAANKEEIAERLHMSGRHLNRLLAEDGARSPKRPCAKTTAAWRTLRESWASLMKVHSQKRSGAGPDNRPASSAKTAEAEWA